LGDESHRYSALLDLLVGAGNRQVEKQIEADFAGLKRVLEGAPA
jgi:hypothetical protein